MASHAMDTHLDSCSRKLETAFHSEFADNLDFSARGTMFLCCIFLIASIKIIRINYNGRGFGRCNLPALAIHRLQKRGKTQISAKSGRNFVRDSSYIKRPNKIVYFALYNRKIVGGDD